MYNDVRGCRNPCRSSLSHVCDVVLASGKVCGSTTHKRVTHVSATHGEPKKGKRT